MSTAAISQSQPPAGEAGGSIDEPPIQSANARSVFMPNRALDQDTFTESKPNTPKAGRSDSTSSGSSSTSSGTLTSSSGDGEYSSGSGLFPSRVRRFKERNGHDKDPTSTWQTCLRAVEARDDASLTALTRSRGIPQSLRARAWPILLANHPFVLSPSLPVAEQHRPSTKNDERTHKRILGELKRLRKRVKSTTGASGPSSLTSSPTLLTPPSWHAPSSSSASSCASSLGGFNDDDLDDEIEKDVFGAIQTAVSSYLTKWAGRAKYEPSMVWTAYFLTQVGIRGQDLTPVFEHAMLVFGHVDEQDDISKCISHFIGKLRAVCPDVAAHFDAEDILNSIGGDEWLSWWIKSFGARAFAPDDIARLWDIYFAYRTDASGDTVWRNNPPPRTQHMFVCLAVMKSLKGQLLELDQSEIRQLLGKVPRSKDPALVVTEAETLWEASIAP